MSEGFEERRQASHSTMDRLADRAEALRNRIQEEGLMVPKELTVDNRTMYEGLASDPDNFEAASLCWLLGDIVVLQGDRWISVINQTPVPTDIVHEFGRVLRVDPTVTPADIYDAEAIHP